MVSIPKAAKVPMANRAAFAEAMWLAIEAGWE
jgi:hypothetical protein